MSAALISALTLAAVGVYADEPLTDEELGISSGGAVAVQDDAGANEAPDADADVEKKTEDESEPADEDADVANDGYSAANDGDISSSFPRGAEGAGEEPTGDERNAGNPSSADSDTAVADVGGAGKVSSGAIGAMLDEDAEALKGVTVDLSEAGGDVTVEDSVESGKYVIKATGGADLFDGGVVTTGGVLVNDNAKIVFRSKQAVTNGIDINTGATVKLENLSIKNNGVRLNADGACVTLDNVNINNANGAAVQVAAQKTATVLLAGDNTVQSGYGYAGIHLVGSASASCYTTVNVDSAESGAALKATGGYLGAGIGGGEKNTSNYRVNIKGGIISAYGGGDASAIGGGGTYQTNMEINISGGSIPIAQGSTNGAPGIGAGRYCQGTMVINISGGEIGRAGSEGYGYDPDYGAFGGHCAAGIGGGNYWNTNTTKGIINISGGTIYNTVASDEGTGIGEGGNNKGNMEINISGGRIVRAKGTGSGAGIGAGAAGDNGSTVQVYVTGGEIDESVSSGQPGIGGGGSGAVTVKVTGGTIKDARGTIGLGALASGSPKVEITGGKVSATSTGSGYPAVGGVSGLLITGGNVTGTGTYGPGIGGSWGVEISGDATVLGIGAADGRYNGIGYQNNSNVKIVAKDGMQPKVSATARNYAALSTGTQTQGIAAANLYFAETGTGSVTTSAKSPYGSDLIINPQGADENVASSVVKGKGWYEQLEDASTYAARAEAVYGWHTNYYNTIVTQGTGFSFDAWGYARGYFSSNNGVNLFTAASVANWKTLKTGMDEYYTQFVSAFAAFQSEGNPNAVRPARDWASYPDEPEIVVLPHEGYTSFAYSGQEGDYVNEVELPSGQKVVAWTFENYRSGETKEIALDAANLANPVPVRIMGENGEPGIPSKIIYDKNIADDSAYPLLTPAEWYADDTIGFGEKIGDLEGSGYAQSKATAPTRAGYVFRGWSAFIGGEGQGVWVDNVGPNSRIYGETTLHANWEPEVYSISYYMPQEVSEYKGGGSDLSRFNRLYTAEQLPTTSLLVGNEDNANNLDVEGHSFVGWQVRIQGADGQLIPLELTDDGLLPAGTHGDIVLVAKYDTDYFKLSYEYNGGADSRGNPARNPVSLKWGTEIGDYLPALTKDGYGFEGWYTSADCAEGTEVTESARIKDDMTVYARWGEIKELSPTGPGIEEPTGPAIEPTGPAIDPTGTAITTEPAVEDADTTGPGLVATDTDTPAAEGGGNGALAATLDPAAAGTTTVTPVQVVQNIVADAAQALNDAAEAVGIPTQSVPQATRTAADEPAGTEIGDTATPRGTSERTWPILNLIFMLAGAAAGALVLIARRRRADGAGDALTAYENAETDRRGRRGKAIVVATTVAAVAGVALWFFTQEIAGRMVLADGYTILQGVVMAAAAACAALAMRGRARKSGENRTEMFKPEFIGK